MKHLPDIAKAAVLTAMRVSQRIQQELSNELAITKKDRSPVTIADFTVQAIICNRLFTAFPDIPIVAEESSHALGKDENRHLMEKILYYIEHDAEVKQWLNRENLLPTIDYGTRSPGSRFWTLDPIDGTKGFLRGEQYAIALALIENGEVMWGCLGCPNMILAEKPQSKGYILTARRGGGADLLDSGSGEWKKGAISVKTDPRRMIQVQSYESSHGNASLQNRISEILGLEKEPRPMDSQVKYGMLAAGEVDIYVRIPHPDSLDYKEKIWDHAAGSLIVSEAGGVVSDIFGRPLDFTTGKRLENNTGVLVAVPAVHQRVVDIIKDLF